MNAAGRRCLVCALCLGLLAGGCAVLHVSVPKMPRAAARIGKPRVPIDAKLEIVGGKVPERGAARFRLSVTSGVDSDNVRMSIKLPTGVRLLDGPAWWRGKVKAGRPYRMEISALVPHSSSHKVIGDIVLISNKGAQLRKRVVLNIDMGKPRVRAGVAKTGHRHRAVPLGELGEKKGR